MEIQTTRFGTVQFPKDLIFEIQGGLLGFPDAERFAVLEHDSEGSPFKWLQAVDDPNLAFIILDPHRVLPDYISRIEKDAHDALGPFDPQDISCISLVTVPQDRPVEMTANLRAPVLVKFSERRGKQIILVDESLSMRHRLFDDAGNESAPAASPA